MEPTVMESTVMEPTRGPTVKATAAAPPGRDRSGEGEDQHRHKRQTEDREQHGKLPHRVILAGLRAHPSL
jgi:hypothetical protein